MTKFLDLYEGGSDKKLEKLAVIPEVSHYCNSWNIPGLLCFWLFWAHNCLNT